MRNLANAKCFAINAIPFVLDDNLNMHFGDAIFEPLNCKDPDKLMDDISNGKEINVRYSAHLDGHEPYVEFSIKCHAVSKTVIGKKIK